MSALTDIGGPMGNVWRELCSWGGSVEWWRAMGKANTASGSSLLVHLCPVLRPVWGDSSTMGGRCKAERRALESA